MTSWRFINLKRLSKMRSWTIEVSSVFSWTALESLESWESWESWKSWKLLDLFFINRVGFCKSNKLSWSSLICLRAFIAITLAIIDSKRAEFSFKLSISCSQLGQSTKQIDELVQCQSLIEFDRTRKLDMQGLAIFSNPNPKKTQCFKIAKPELKKNPENWDRSNSELSELKKILTNNDAFWPIFGQNFLSNP